MSDDDLWSIGQMATHSGVSLRTLRFYEQRGLIQPIRVGQERRYGKRTRDRLKVILDATRAGFSLREIGEKLQADKHVGSLEHLFTLAEIKAQLELLEKQKADLEERISELQKLESGPGGQPPRQH